MADCIHHIDICPECDGLIAVQLDRLEGVDSVRLNIDGPSPFRFDGPTQVYIGPAIEPCNQPAESTEETS